MKPELHYRIAALKIRPVIISAKCTVANAGMAEDYYSTRGYAAKGGLHALLGPMNATRWTECLHACSRLTRANGTGD